MSGGREAGDSASQRDCKLAAAVRAGLWDDTIMFEILADVRKVGVRIESGVRGVWKCRTYENYGIHELCPHHAEGEERARNEWQRK